MAGLPSNVSDAVRRRNPGLYAPAPPRPPEGAAAPSGARPPSGKGGASKLEDRFADLWARGGGPSLVREHRFHPGRKWRFDFASPELKVAVEVEGGIFSQGRHNRAMTYAGDCDKYNAAAMLGWVVLRITEVQLRDPDYVATLAAWASRRQPENSRCERDGAMP